MTPRTGGARFAARDNGLSRLSRTSAWVWLGSLAATAGIITALPGSTHSTGGTTSATTSSSTTSSSSATAPSSTSNAPVVHSGGS